MTKKFPACGGKKVKNGQNDKEKKEGRGGERKRHRGRELAYSMEMDRLRKRTHGLVFKTKMGQKTVKKVKIGQIGQNRVKIGSK